MSGSDQSFNAPKHLTPISVDQPIGLDRQGSPVMPTIYFAQMIQRILSYIGQPASNSPSSGGGSGSGNGITISQSITNITNDTVVNTFGLNAANIGQNAQSDEFATALMRLSGRLPGTPGDLSLPHVSLPPIPIVPPTPHMPFMPMPMPAPMPMSMPFMPAPQAMHGLPIQPQDQLASLADVNINVPNYPNALIYDPVDRIWKNGHIPTEVTFNWTKVNDPGSTILYTAPRSVMVVAIIGRLEVPEGGAATIAVYKAPNGTALAAGTILHTGTFNANGTAATNQTLALVSVAVATLAANDSIGILTTGAWTNSSGGLTISLIYT